MKNIQDLINNNKILYPLGIFILFLYFLPYFIYGQNVHMTTYDNLDSNIVWFKILAESGKIFADSMEIIPNMMSGLPRLSYGTEFNVTLWLYYFLPTFTAYVINDILVHTVAFSGMAILLSHYIINKDLKYYNIIVFSVALLFALLPFWSNGGLSVAGQPLALYAFLNIRGHRDNKWDWAILILLPFYSSFILAFFFFLSAAGFLFIYDIFITKKINYRFIFAIILMIIINLLVEYRLVYTMLLDSGFVSHRSVFNLSLDSFNTAFKKAHIIFLNGQDHNINLQYKFILPLILLALFSSFKKSPFGKTSSIIILTTFIVMFILNIWKDLLTVELSLPILLGFTIILWIHTKDHKLFSFLFIIQILISFLTGFYFYTEMAIIKEIFPIMGKFHFARFMMLQTLIWYILLAYSLTLLFEKFKFFIWIFLALFIFQTKLAFENKIFNRDYFEPSTYKTYYAEDLYKQIEKFIVRPKNSYRIVSLGIEPAVSLYNGFYTIDGYSPNYPLSYKYKFRKIMEKYLDNIKKHYGDTRTFDDWGSKCYIMTGMFSTKACKKDLLLRNLPINIDQLSHLDVDYIFSAYEIEDYKHMKLIFLKKFDDNKTHWPVYLYKLK